MQVAHRWGDRNLSRMELVIALLFMAIFIGIFSRYALTVFTSAEKNLVNSTLININTALHYRAAMSVMQGDFQALDNLLRSNPMEDMQGAGEVDIPANNDAFPAISLLGGLFKVPGNYASEIYSDNNFQIEEGKWYFNKLEGYLVYFIDNDELFLSDLEGPPRLRYKTRMKFDDVNGNGQYDPEFDEFVTMRLESLDSFEWGG